MTLKTYYCMSQGHFTNFCMPIFNLMTLIQLLFNLVHLII